MKKALSLVLTLTAIAILVNTPRIHASPAPTVSVTSVYNVTVPGVTFLVNITATDVSDLFMWVINLEWDPNMIKISTGDTNGLKRRGTYYNIFEGPFLKSMRTTVFLANDINNTQGKITALSAGYMAHGTTASGSGVLAVINFTCIEAGTTTIEITGPSTAYPGQSMLIDHTGKEMTHEDRNGVVSDQPPPESPFWTQLWFQATLVIIIVIVVAAAYVAMGRKSIKKSG